MNNSPTVIFKYIVIILGLYSHTLSAINNIDSLHQLWEDESLIPEERAEALKDFIIEGYITTKTDSAFFFIETLNTFCNEYSFPSCASKVLYLKAYYLYQKGDLPESISYCLSAIKSFQLNQDETGHADALSLLVLNYYTQGKYIEAIEQNKIVMEMYEKLEDQKGIGEALLAYGLIYYRQNIQDKALEYYQKAYKILGRSGNPVTMASSLLHVGLVHYGKDEYEESLIYLSQSLEIAEANNLKASRFKALANIGTLYQIFYKDYEKALDYLFKSLEQCKEINHQLGTSNSLVNIGQVYEDMGKFELAIKYCKEAYELSNAIGALPKKRTSCACLYRCYKAEGKGNLALEYHEKYMELEEGLKKGATSTKLERVEFNKEKKETLLAHKYEMKERTLRNNIFICLCLLFLVLSVYLFTRWKNTRKEKSRLVTEKNKSEKLLLNMLPADVLQELKEKGKAQAREYTQVSVLFSDFKAFTQLAEKMSPKKLVKNIDQFFMAFDEIMKKYNVEKIKTIGDSYMAAGGFPVQTKESLSNTVLAALEMQEFMNEINQKKLLRNEIPFEMRLGIHTGDVVAGIIGTDKYQYDMWGDTVNTASRMENNGKVGKVNVSEDCYQLLVNDPRFKFIERETIKVKGKGNSKMYFVEKNQ